MSEVNPDFLLQYQDYTGRNHPIPLNKGDMLFVLGANGTGKTGLLQNFTAQNSKVAQRIIAHRQNWFHTDSIDLTPAHKIQVERGIRKFDTNYQSRFSDNHAAHRSQIVLYNLLDSENKRNKNIADAVDANDQALLEREKQVPSPINRLNELLASSSLLIEIYQNEHGSFYARKKGGEGYSISQLSDGERNAILIICEVLTALEGRLFLIDEPERHLHRSIISPLISSLLLERPDCAFVISTHEINLPIDNPASNILLVRGCRRDKNQQLWDADLIDSADDVDVEVKRDILGAHRMLLFVEGNGESLDYQIYKLLFPDISVIPQKTCKEVVKAVKGISETENLQWIKAFGLIDKDDRTDQEVKDLRTENIFALNSYAVESLYYDPEVIKKLAEVKTSCEGGDSEALINDANNKILDIVKKNQEDLCARLCERKIKDKIRPPTWKDIKSEKYDAETPDIKEIFKNEKEYLRKLLEKKDIKKIVSRYPIKNTPCCSKVARALNYQSKQVYERAVQHQILHSPDLRKHLQKELQALTEAIAKKY